MRHKQVVSERGGMCGSDRRRSRLCEVCRTRHGIEGDDASPVEKGLRLRGIRWWSERQGDGVIAIEAKGQVFDPAKMEAITMIPPSEHYAAGPVVEVLEEGYMYKSKVVTVARVVVASE